LRLSPALSRKRQFDLFFQSNLSETICQSSKYPHAISFATRAKYDIYDGVIFARFRTEKRSKSTFFIICDEIFVAFSSKPY
jgi:hypothetical protein